MTLTAPLDEFGRPVDSNGELVMPQNSTRVAPVQPAPALPPRLLNGTTLTPLTPDDALQALAYSQGNPALAAERLGITHPDGASQLLAILALDESIHPRAQGILRFMQLAKLLGSLQYVEATLLEKLEDMEPKEVARTYTAMVLAAELLTKAAAAPGSPAANATQNNVTINLLRLLPPDVREAMRALLPPDMATTSLGASPTLVMPGAAVDPPVQPIHDPDEPP